MTDLDPRKFPGGLDGCPVCSDEELLREFPPDRLDLALGIGSTGPVRAGHPRRRVVQRMSEAGYVFPALPHASAWSAASAVFGRGTQIHAGAVVQPGAVLGDFVIVNTRASVDHDCCIGDFVHLAPGAVLSGGVTVGEGSHVGVGSVVREGIRIGREVLVAAGAVVVRDVPDGCLVAGVPATPRPRPEETE